MQQRRLHAAGLFTHGHTQAQVARALGVSRQAAHTWQRRWLAGGAHALHAASPVGRRPRCRHPTRPTQAGPTGRAHAHGYDADL
ncbi:MAG TPA: helix-turn-helix domain-containing protein [Actinomycetes bacterium]|nr:helix-turn-helix domain-containing protein [Actinomycetes bacterium]